MADYTRPDISPLERAEYLIDELGERSAPGGPGGSLIDPIVAAINAVLEDAARVAERAGSPGAAVAIRALREDEG